jgi:6-pyruvoyl-tetrahydropterin synthase
MNKTELMINMASNIDALVEDFRELSDNPTTNDIHQHVVDDLNAELAAAKQLIADNGFSNTRLENQIVKNINRELEDACQQHQDKLFDVLRHNTELYAQCVTYEQTILRLKDQIKDLTGAKAA